MSEPNRRRCCGIKLLLILCTLFTGGCETTGFGPTKEERTRVEDSYSVVAPVRWTKFSQRSWELWTVDGPGLQALYLLDGVETGKPLVPVNTDKGWPLLKSGMLKLELIELVVDTLGRSGYQQIQTQRMRPAMFGSVEGFRFEFSFLFADGLEGKGLVTGAIIREKLQLILYVGAAEHYFDQHLADVEKIIDSVKVLP